MAGCFQKNPLRAGLVLGNIDSREVLLKGSQHESFGRAMATCLVCLRPSKFQLKYGANSNLSMGQILTHGMDEVQAFHG